MGAMGFGKTSGSERLASMLILFSGDHFQVLGIDTPSIAAEVVNLQPARDRPFGDLIHSPVTVAHLFAEHDLRVACGSSGARPLPAAAFRDLDAIHQLSQVIGVVACSVRLGVGSG